MKMPSQKVLIGLIVGLIVLMVVAGTGTALAYQVYTVRADGAFVRQFGSGLPAAKVGSHSISYGAFLNTRDTLRVYLGSEAGKAAGAPPEVTPEIEKQALNRLMREQIIKDVAAEKNISVSDAEVRNSFDVMAAMNSSTVPDVGKFLQENYHWTEQQFQDNVVKPAILEERVALTFTTSTKEQLTEADWQNVWAMMESFMQNRIAQPDVKIYLKFDK